MRDPILNKMLENYDGKKIVLRPSSIDGFTNCSRQWAATFIGGQVTIPSGRAAIGTAIHAGIEQGWRESQAAKTKMFNHLDSLTSLGADNLIEQQNDLDIQWDDGENLDTAIAEVCSGIKTYASDIVPFTSIPHKVEHRVTMQLDGHPIVEALSGTIDYLTTDTVGDVKTSKRKPVAQSYETQQTLYTMLAKHEGYDIKHNLIQGIVLKAKPEGVILELEPAESKAKMAVNTLLDVVEVFHEQQVSPDVLFRGNPKYYLCDKKYCSLYSTCPYVK